MCAYDVLGLHVPRYMLPTTQCIEFATAHNFSHTVETYGRERQRRERLTYLLFGFGTHQWHAAKKCLRMENSSHHHQNST